MSRSKSVGLDRKGEKKAAIAGCLFLSDSESEGEAYCQLHLSWRVGEVAVRIRDLSEGAVEVQHGNSIAGGTDAARSTRTGVELACGGISKRVLVCRIEMVEEVERLSDELCAVAVMEGEMLR
jgi:hypothetical protein